MNSYLMVDRATPPTTAEISMLKANKVVAVGAYCGGANNGGRAWQPADFARMRTTGFQILPIYVGENVCDGCKTPVTLTAAQGKSDGADAIACAKKFGCNDGPLALDIEYGTYTSNVAGALAYMAAWATVVHGAGFLPVQYAITATATDYKPTVPTGLWIANWDGKGDLSAFPNAARFAGVGWQYADNWNGFDVSHVDGQWWAVPASTTPIPLQSEYFPQTGHGIGGGFYRFWSANGDLKVFGYPISDEYIDATAKRTMQDFERARFELHPDDGNSADWNVELGLVNTELVQLKSQVQSQNALIAAWPKLDQAIDALRQLVPKSPH